MLNPDSASSRLISPERPGRTFAVHDVAVGTKPLPEVDPKSAIEEGMGRIRVEACSDYRGTIVACRSHPLVAATWWAYDEHRPLILSPDIVWLTIAQGVAVHINENAEALRHQFVSHAGQETLKVIRDDFVKGSPENPWDEVIDDFSRQVGERIGPMHGRIVSDFSTTGKVERVASEVVLMDAMQRYFSYECYSMCGIPAVTLEGTTGDWTKIRARVDAFDEWGLSWWTEALRPVLDQFVAASEGNVDRAFWRSIFKRNDESGGPYLSGWLLRLFPYLQSPQYEKPSYRRTGRMLQHRNPYLADGSGEGHFEGVTTGRLPSGLARAPFVWEYLGNRFDYAFVAGLIGIEQDHSTMALRPKIGWAVHPVPDSSPG